MDTLPDDARHTFHAGVMSHAQVRTLCPGRMATAGQLALDRHRGPLRSFIRQSSGSLDLRQTALLTVEMAGDWDGLRSALRAVLNASVSGIPLVGLEIDGAEGDLMVRALQAGCMLPGLLGWTQRDGAGLPWSFGAEIENACRETLSLRSRILPYLYTCIALAREYGVPVLRPLWMLQPENTALWGIEDAYLIGDHLLAAPVLQIGKVERSVMLPDGVWYDYWTNNVIEGGKAHVVEAPLNRLPLFVRAGAVLPLASGGHAGEQIPIVRVYPGDSETTTYDDPGEGFSHLNGDYRWVYYTCHWESNRCFVLQRRRTGGFYPSDKRLRFEVVGLGEPPEEVRLDRHGAPLWYYDQDRLEIVADDEAGRVEVWLEGSPTAPTRKRRAL
jgi:alpha-glucosidase